MEDSTQKLNDQIEAYTNEIIAAYEADLKAAGTEGTQAVDLDYEVVTDSDKLFSIQHGGGNGRGSSDNPDGKSRGFLFPFFGQASDGVRGFLFPFFGQASDGVRGFQESPVRQFCRGGGLRQLGFGFCNGKLHVLPQGLRDGDVFIILFDVV